MEIKLNKNEEMIVSMFPLIVICHLEDACISEEVAISIDDKNRDVLKLLQGHYLELES